MPWRDKGLPPGITANAAEAKLLARLQQTSRLARYNSGEAEDLARAAVEACARHMEATCPDADFVILGCVPFGSDAAAGRGPGNAIAQRIAGGKLLGMSMREDVLPQQVRFFTKTSSFWSTAIARLAVCFKILFGKDPRGYEKDDV